MSGFAYALPNPQILDHAAGFDLPSWLADGDFGEDAVQEESHLYRDFTADDALAASGDCFVTLATRLDKLAQGLPLDSAEQIEIEHIVRSLLYLQDNYVVLARYKLGE